MPDGRDVIRKRLAALNLTAPAESDLAEEFAQHLEDRYRDLTAQGLEPTDAYSRVLGELDARHPITANVPAGQYLRQHELVPPGDSRRGGFLDGLLRDFRYAGRSIRNNPVFVAFVVLTVAIGIGANTTVFTLLNTLMLNPLPVRNPGELAAVVGADVDPSKPIASLPLSYLDLTDYQAHNAVFVSLAGYTSPRLLT